MSRLPVVIDLETKYTFREKKDVRELGISVFGIYDYAKDKIWVVREENIAEVFPFLENASYIIGYNVEKFDLQVLQKYYPGDVRRLPSFDLMEDIKKRVGKRIALDEVLYATLNAKKIGHGLKAVEDYKKGNWKDLEAYCLEDVRLTKELFDFGVRNGKIFYPTAEGKEEIRVDWKKFLYEDSKSDVSLTLPF